MNEKQFFKVIIDGLVGKPQGSRVAIAATVKDVWGSAGAPQLKLKTTDTVLFVIDVLSVEPTDVLDAPKGKDVAAPADAPGGPGERRQGHRHRLLQGPEEGPDQAPGHPAGRG